MRADNSFEVTMAMGNLWLMFSTAASARREVKVLARQVEQVGLLCEGRCQVTKDDVKAVESHI